MSACVFSGGQSPPPIQKQLALAIAGVLGLLAAAGCSGDCCTVDSFPIIGGRAPLGPLAATAPGALLAAASDDADGAAGFKMLIDTGTPLTILGGEPGSTLTLGPRSFRLHDATADAPTRGLFRGINSLQLPLHPAGTADVVVGGVMGADLLAGFSVDIRMGASCSAGTAPSLMCPSVTLWDHQGASDGFLADGGFAVIPFTAYGGGEVSAQSTGDFLGLSGPISVAPSRIVLRTCAAPRAFSPDEPVETCCTAREAIEKATGANLSLLLATGVGPLVLSQSAWDRLAATIDPASVPPLTDGDLLIATWPAPIKAGWTTIPRIAVVNMEVSADNNPGACVELARSRRIEWVAVRQQQAQKKAQSTAECVQPCDTDPVAPDEAQNSAAYMEIDGGVPVAVIRDVEGDRWLQGLRFDVRPEGPDLDGVLGAGALGPVHMEIDFRSSQHRLIFSCDGAARDTCWAAGRCPRLPDKTQKHVCFGLGAHGLPQTCVPSGCSVQ